ncbi:MAG: DUF1918 domain-containing protein [Ilumatobacteraceae bacterium]
MNIHARVGDGIQVDSMELGHPPRKGEVIAVMGDGDIQHYLVRWDDGRESYFYPGTTSHVVHTAHRDGTTAVEHAHTRDIEMAQHPAAAAVTRRT